MLLGIRIATPLLKFCLPFVDLYILDVYILTKKCAG